MIRPINNRFVVSSNWTNLFICTDLFFFSNSYTLNKRIWSIFISLVKLVVEFIGTMMSLKNFEKWPWIHLICMRGLQLSQTLSTWFLLIQWQRNGFHSTNISSSICIHWIMLRAAIDRIFEVLFFLVTICAFDVLLLSETSFCVNKQEIIV